MLKILQFQTKIIYEYGFHFLKAVPVKIGNVLCLVLIGDEVVVTKSGKKTYGLGRFFSFIQNQAVPGLCFINISLLHVESRKSYPLLAEQLLKKSPGNCA
ncbi:hypothetical protein BMR10_16600 [Methylococcaceae bacterium CS4]|nr:hypothetical protein BMR10_16600 [Methylococcaceae bacterium CS4]